MTTSFDITTLLQSGLSIIPIAQKTPTIKSWTEYQTRLPKPGELEYSDGYALICGKISGNIEVLNIDVKNDPSKQLLARIKQAFGPEFFNEIQQNTIIQSTPSGGYHFIYRCGTIDSNQKLALNAQGQTLIETKGEGDYIVINPTAGYTLKKGSFLNIPFITSEQRHKLHQLCSSLSEQNGIQLQPEDDRPKILTYIQKLELWLNDHYEFRKNVLTSTTISREKPDGVWQECNENDIWRALQHNLNDFKGPKGGVPKMPLSDIQTLLDSDFVPKFNPLVHYFNNLPSWDQIDHISSLASFVQTDNQIFWIDQFKKALVRSLACTLSGIANRIVMTLVSEEQELGKSNFLRFLCPPDLRQYYKEEPLLHEKDSEIALAENFIWNLEELDDLNKKQISEMKAIISRESIKHRRAYARRESSMKRIVNFWGSTNKTEFLTDTKNTRWLCFNVISINHDYNNTTTGVRKIDINKVWAQAYHLYKSGFSFHLSESDRKIRDTNNKLFESMPEEKQLIIRHFKPGKPNDPETEFLENIKIKQILDNLTTSKTHLFEQNIGRALSQLGYVSQKKYINGKQMRGWYIIPLKNQASFESDPILDDQTSIPF